jgi:3-deoxy-D-manno-octulosonic-acid transferase
MVTRRAESSKSSENRAEAAGAKSRLMRAVYVRLSYLLAPVYGLYWVFRGFAQKAYLERFGQRFGFSYPTSGAKTIWIHAVSVGEVQATAPLVRQLARRYPSHPIHVTTVTPTGAARARALYGDSVSHSYIPFEIPFAINRFFSAVKPGVALIMETEIWPNLYHACSVRDIPLVLVSARISPKSVGKYRRLLPLFRKTLSYGIVIAAQSEADAERFRSLGASPDRTFVTGNIKFDIELPEDLPAAGIAFHANVFGERPVWIAASTHEGEEEQVLDAHELLQQSVPEALLVLVPRHPDRFADVANLLQRRGIKTVSRTANTKCSVDTDVFLGNTMGELPLFYAASDIAFVGGTLVPVGGHNLLEPAALGRPIVTGPNLFNTQDIADMFTSVGASTIVHDAAELATRLSELFADQGLAGVVGNKGREIVRENRGALDRFLLQLEPLMKNF